MPAMRTSFGNRSVVTQEQDRRIGEAGVLDPFLECDAVVHMRRQRLVVERRDQFIVDQHVHAA
jgi:hypothetical protein